MEKQKFTFSSASNREQSDQDHTANWNGVRVDKWGYALCFVIVVVWAVISVN